MMGECEPLHLRVLGELHGVFDRAVAPASLGRVLRGGVLPVVYEKVCVANKLGISQVLPGDLPLAAGQGPRMRLVIAAIYERGAVFLQAIAERKRRMVQVVGGHLYGVDIE